MAQKKIYLAGPSVFRKDPITEGKMLKTLCQHYDFEGLYPMDASLDLSNMTKGEAAQAIYQANIDFIRQSDGVIADMQPFRGPGMDEGTAFEIGFAVGLGIPVVGYGSTRIYKDRCKDHYDSFEEDPEGFIVEDFDQVDNLMLTCGATALVKDETEALAYLKVFFDGQEKSGGL
jgi:nucleoside 2-deoxyribosyltransferase